MGARVTDSTSPKMNSASCLPGTLSAIGGMNGADSGQVALFSRYPDGTPAEGVVITTEDRDGYGGQSSIEAWAICG